MPCKSDYLEPSGHELESKRVCSLLVYLYSKLQKEIQPWILHAKDYIYGNTDRLDEATKLLCECCRSLTEKEVNNYIYDAHNENARKLASWWERHQEWDKRRVLEEEAAKALAIVRNKALQKLTAEEIQALGLLD